MHCVESDDMICDVKKRCVACVSNADQHIFPVKLRKGGFYLEYRTFLELIQQEVKRQIGAEGMVQVNHMIKNNSTPKDSMSILYAGENISPAIYLDYFYEEYQEHIPIGQIAEQILSCYRHNKKTGRTNLDFYLNFGKIRERIFCKIVNYERNLPALELVPHRRFLDLAIVYYCEVESDDFGMGTVLVQNPHLLLWRIDPKELHEIAVYNTLHYAPYDFIEVSEMVEDMTGVVIEPCLSNLVPMYVLSNVKKYFGAVSIYFPEVLEKIGERLLADFYVLPSSIHECMIVPVNDQLTIQGADYQEMVEEINERFVVAEEILGDSVYRYYRAEKELRIVAQHGGEESAVKA